MYKKYYPAFLDINGRPCVVIGGGDVAERKVERLIKSGAVVTVISPVLTDKLKKRKLERSIRHIKRKYRTGDLSGAFIAIAATDSYEENKRVSDDAGNMPVNVVDTPDLCSFIVPSIVQRGPLTIAVSTSGTSPAMAKTIRKELEKNYPSCIGGYLESIAEKRTIAINNMCDAKKRARRLKSLASAEILTKLRTKT